ncbi:hypothetical protein C5167_042881 [Papaver somniferum]|uniref:Uncharacterized protein n=1 Tax=Papaver somniferum TaxID=3469 RepID=A0A4Y7L431_PAPSO|nr:hypothetical protein C5167_042881 [Papaver somniferum]
MNDRGKSPLLHATMAGDMNIVDYPLGKGLILRHLTPKVTVLRIALLKKLFISTTDGIYHIWSSIGGDGEGRELYTYGGGGNSGSGKLYTYGGDGKFYICDGSGHGDDGGEEMYTYGGNNDASGRELHTYGGGGDCDGEGGDL